MLTRATLFEKLGGKDAVNLAVDKFYEKVGARMTQQQQQQQQLARQHSKTRRRLSSMLCLLPACLRAGPC